MCNKFKLKKKLLSIALALVLAAQPLMSLPMNVFAGTDKIGSTTADELFHVPFTFTVPGSGN